MIGLNNSDYYRRRAEQAERLASAATMPEVRLIHRNMAEHYASLAAQSEPAPKRPALRLAY